MPIANWLETGALMPKRDKPAFEKKLIIIINWLLPPIRSFKN